MLHRSASWLRRRRKALLRKLPDLEAILKGSLVVCFKRCGKPGCKCARGPGHGPKYYLSISQTGTRPRMEYVPQDYHDQVQEYLANHHRVREILAEISALNRELLRRRKPL